MLLIDTVLDPRFSTSGASPTSWEQTRRILADAVVSWISTVRVDGRPHVTPLVTVWLDDALYFTSGPGEQKVRNLDHNPAVAKSPFTQTRHRFLENDQRTPS